MKSFILVLIVMSNQSNSDSAVAISQEYSSQQTCQAALVKLTGQVVGWNAKVVASLCSEK